MKNVIKNKMPSDGLLCFGYIDFNDVKTCLVLNSPYLFVNLKQQPNKDSQ